jgi:4-hydroxybenzoate polyprenyltransferase
VITFRAIPGLVRPFTLLAPVVGTACAAGVAHGARAVAFDVGAVALAAGSAAAAVGASNAWNQAFDADLDRVNKPHRPIPAGRATPAQAIVLGDVLALVSLGLGAAVSPGFIACVAVGILGTWIYSAPPLRTKRHPVFANVTIAIPRGLLVPVAGWSVLASPGDPEPWGLGVVLALFVLGAAGTKDFADVEGDRAHGCRTLPVLLGPERAARWIAPSLFVPWLLYPLLGAFGWLTPGVGRLAVLGGVLTAGGLLTARALLADPARLARGDGNHPAWRGMYLLMVGAQVGTAIVYLL